MERTFIAVKPDGVIRGLVGEVISRFERKGWKMIGCKLMTASEALLDEHYAEHRGKPFVAGLIKYMRSGPVVAMAWEGTDIVRQSRKLIGATRPHEAECGSLRGDYCVSVEENLVHGSDAVDSGKREVSLWFKEAELSSSQ